MLDSVYFVAFRYGHHASRSGYDRFADYLGERVEVSPQFARHGDGLLKVPAKVVESYSGVFEYRRPDVIQELAVLRHASRSRGNIYHFLYAEKSLYMLAGRNGWRGHRVIGSFHHTADSYPERFRSTKFLRNIEHAVVVSRSQIDFMESLVGAGKVSFVPYAVDTQYFVPARRDPSRPLRCTCLGEHMRDFETLEAVIAGVGSSIPAVEFVVVGARPDCEASLRTHRSVIWKRGISDPEYLEILQQTDLLVLPLRDSTSVTSVNEALACGVPVISNEGGVADYVNDQCAVLHPVGDVDSMVDSVVTLLKDETRRSQMSQAARTHGESLDWPLSAAKMESVYRQIQGVTPKPAEEALNV